MSTDPTDPVAAYLEQVQKLAADERADIGLAPGDTASSADHIPRLAGALEAVLAIHEPGPVMIFGSLCATHEAHRHFSITRTEADDVAACPDCPATVFTPCARCSGRPAWPCAEYRAISAALLGKDSTDEH